MDDERLQQLYKAEADTLAQIGAVFDAADLGRVEVRVPAQLADAAVAAWQRDDPTDRGATETVEQRLARHRAGALALIGLSIERDGRVEGENVTVGLSVGLIGTAVDAATDLGSSE